jgi:hypothetical protein
MEMKRNPFLEIGCSNTHFCGRMCAAIKDPDYRRTTTQETIEGLRRYDETLDGQPWPNRGSRYRYPES